MWLLTQAGPSSRKATSLPGSKKGAPSSPRSTRGSSNNACPTVSRTPPDPQYGMLPGMVPRSSRLIGTRWPSSNEPAAAAARSRQRFRSPRNLDEQALYLVLQGFDLGVDLHQRAGGHVMVEVPRQRDLISELGPIVFDPGIRNVWQHLIAHVVIDGRPILQHRKPIGGVRYELHGHVRQRHVLVVA